MKLVKPFKESLLKFLIKYFFEFINLNNLLNILYLLKSDHYD